jgi:hypothetical protein
MELFLNLCWLSLLLPAFLLWRQRAVEDRPVESVTRPLLFLCALGCALILLFPVISASDDLHAMRPEMEESERASRHANHCACTSHAPAHTLQSALPGAASLTPEFEQVGAVLPLAPQTIAIFSAPASAGRAPPIDNQTSL